MLYIDENFIGEGRYKRWRLFADTSEELRSALREVGAYDRLLSEGTPTEHVVISTTVKNRLKAETLDERGLVKLIRRKRNGETPEIFPGKIKLYGSENRNAAPEETPEADWRDPEYLHEESDEVDEDYD